MGVVVNKATENKMAKNKVIRNNPLKVVVVLMLFSGIALANDTTKQQITKFDQHVIQDAPTSNFSGKAQFSRLPVMPSAGDVAPATVTFSPGAITNWHIHPNGQYLIVIDGEGRTQEWGQPIQNISKGDVIWCPPGVKHWHGASTHSSMTHIAISPVAKPDEKVTWLEKVTVLEKVAGLEKFKVPQSAQPLNANEKQKINASTPLTNRQLSLIPIAAFTATGDLEQLKPALVKGLEAGLTVNEIKEALAHQYAYVGFPRSLNGLLTFKSLLEQRQQQNIKDTIGAAPSAPEGGTNYYQLGTETLSILTNAPADKPLVDNFSPTIDYALKAHLFGYLFSRDNLNYIDRELVTIATLAALGNVNNQLTSHFKVVQNLGLKDSQFQQIIATLKTDVNADVAANSSAVLQQLKSTQTQ
jgi:4-carboxymuconolactone decarboxylase